MQKDEYINALWLLVVGFADLRMPNLFEKTRGQARVEADAVQNARAAMLYSSHSKAVRGFVVAASVATPPKSKREA